MSLQVLSEHHTLRVLENKFLAGTLTTQDSTTLLDTHVKYLERLRTNLEQTDWLERDRMAQKLPFIFERFHFSHVYHYDTVDWADVVDIDKRLLELGTKVCLFTIDPDDIQERIIEDYKKSGWQDYLKTLGSNDTEIKAHFVRQQDEILKLIDKTVLQVKIIETSKLTTNQIVQEVIKYWGLY